MSTRFDERIIDCFEQSLRGAGLSESTVRAYRYGVRQFVAWLLRLRAGVETPLTISQADVLSYHRHLREQHLHASTVNQRLQALRRFVAWAGAHGVLRTAAAPLVPRVAVPRRQRATPRALAVHEQHALLRAAGQSPRNARRNYALVQLLLRTGIRTGEAVALAVRDLRIAARASEMQTPGPHSRTIALDAATRRALRSYFATRRSVSPESPVFLSDRGRRMSARAIQVLIATLARRAKIRGRRVTPQTLRHTFALRWLEREPSGLAALAAALGQDVRETAQLYRIPHMPHGSKPTPAGDDISQIRG